MRGGHALSALGGVFAGYTVTVVHCQADRKPVSPAYDLKMNSHVSAGQQSNIILRRKQ